MPLYLGLVVVLGVVVVKFPFKIWDLMVKALSAEEANLVVMVIISGYENFVSHIETEGIPTS